MKKAKPSSRRIWIEGREFNEIARLAEKESWSDEQLAQYIERKYGKQKKT